MAQGEERRGGRPRPIQDVLKTVLRMRGLATPGRDGRIFHAWRSAAASALPSIGLAESTRPVRFRDGELLVEVASSAHLHELRTFTGEELRRCLNEELGDETVRALAFKLQLH